jgi:adenylosuccinate synthase
VVNTCVIGLQWGDEAKGKLVDILAEDSDVVVRYQGGANAGHTVVDGAQKYALRLIPSGILRKKKCVLGNTVAIYPASLIKEIEGLRKRGVEITPDNFIISNRANLTTQLQIEIDKAKCKKAIGTTGNGIGPTYADKKLRSLFLVNDLFHLDGLEERVRSETDFTNYVLKYFGAGPVDYREVMRELTDAREKLLPFVTKDLHNLMLRHNGSILFEGAQGTWLDSDLGTYPFNTGSTPTFGGIYVGGGTYLPIPRRIGICKAYTTRVGEGPFPTEQDNEVGERLRKRGNEFGTVTGRPRRCGSFDAFLVKTAVEINGSNAICLSKFDVLDTESELLICTGYEIDGKRVEHFPVLDLAQCKPIYESHPGWMQDTTNVRRIKDLPSNARSYVDRIQKLIGAQIYWVGVGADRMGMAV